MKRTPSPFKTPQGEAGVAGEAPPSLQRDHIGLRGDAMCPTDVVVPRSETTALPLPGPGTDWIVGDEGQPLYSRWLRPVHPRGLVWYVLGPECGAAVPYPRLTQALLDAGFVVTLVHARGTGYSPGVRGDITDAHAWLGDSRRFCVESARRFPGVPVFLVGHSAGAAVAADIADVAFGPDREEAVAMQRDSVAVRYFSMRMLLAQKRLMNRLPKNVGALTVPVLVIEGAYDALIDPAGNDELLARARIAGSTKIVARDGGHGSSAVETTVESLVRWLEARLVAPSHAEVAHQAGEAHRYAESGAKTGAVVITVPGRAYGDTRQ